MTKTLREIVAENPDLLDLPVAVLDTHEGNLHYVGASGTLYKSEDEGAPVLVFSGN
jgi:hypothetical protein